MRLTKIKDKFQWLFGSHYKIERFGVMFFSLVFLMVILLCSIISHKHYVDANTLSNQVQYTQEARMSLSGNAINIVGIYLDEKQTEMFMLLQWNEEAKYVADADAYTMFVSGKIQDGSGYEPLLSHPTGAVYMFGSTGYMGLYLVDAAGFPAQIMSIILRCDEVITKQDNIPTYADTSFNEFDQIEILLNPGGADFEPAAFLTEDRMTLYDIYESTVLAGQEDVIKEAMEKNLTDMDMTLRQIDELTSNIEAVEYEGKHVIVPDAPLPIRNDKIVKNRDDQLELETATLFSGGYSFDWRNLTLREGYFETVVPEGTTPARWLGHQQYLGDQTGRADISDTIAETQWYWSDGTKYTPENSLNQPRLKQLSEDISALKQAWMRYYSLKLDYQITQPFNLLSLELQANDATQTYTLKSKDAVNIWY